MTDDAEGEPGLTAEQRTVLDRAVESGTVRDLDEAARLGVHNVIHEQLAFEDFVREVVEPELQAAQKDPALRFTTEQVRQHVHQRIAGRAANRQA